MFIIFSFVYELVLFSEIVMNLRQTIKLWFYFCTKLLNITEIELSYYLFR